jgi:hypothetical protein
VNPILFALFTAGAVAFCQVLARGAETQARLHKATRIERRILEADRGTLKVTR